MASQKYFLLFSFFFSTLFSCSLVLNRYESSCARVVPLYQYKLHFASTCFGCVIFHPLRGLRLCFTCFKDINSALFSLVSSTSPIIKFSLRSLNEVTL